MPHNAKFAGNTGSARREEDILEKTKNKNNFFYSLIGALDS
jgi:hypothetical protein